MRFLLDADMPRSSASVFAARGHEVLDVRDAGLNGLADESIAKFAKKEGRIIITRDVEFGSILRYPPGSYVGIVVIRLAPLQTAEQINRALAGFLDAVKDEELKGSVIIVEPGRYRIRRL